jgi:hypothetical protein
VAAIFPYDAAPVMLARVGGAALLGGNRFRFSCSSQTPRTAAVLREIVAPFPDIELTTGLSNRDFGRQAVLDPEVRVLFISGGGQVGAAYQAEAARFDKLRQAYERSPGVTRQRLYYETVEEVLSRTSKVLVDADGPGNLIYLPLDKLTERRAPMLTLDEQRQGTSAQTRDAIPTDTGSGSNEANRERGTR